MAVDIPRETALKILYDINEKGAYSNISLNKHLEGSGLRSIDRGFITEMVYGTIKWRLKIDWIISRFSSIKLGKISPWILNILRLGVYQMLFMEKIPVSAACDESVKLSKKYGHHASSGFVNGVLRSIARGRDNIEYPDKYKEYGRYLSIKYSHPEWMIKEWLEMFGSEMTEGLLSANNGVPDFTVRVNTLKTTKEQLMARVDGLGMESANGRYIEEAVIIKNPLPVTEMDLFKEGWFQVQDESSMLVGRILDPQPGEIVVDVCSAPGGKAAHIAQLMKNKGTVLARDIHEHKIKLISEAAGRLGFSAIKAEMFDAAETDTSLIGKADRVLVDAPCTGLGIIRRKPDIKWARNMEDKKEITRLQAKILGVASGYVKPGGVLVYSTCTINPEENERIVEAFIRENNDFDMVDITPGLPESLVKPGCEKGYIQLLPNIDGVDGFFIAKLKKKPD